MSLNSYEEKYEEERRRVLRALGLLREEETEGEEAGEEAPAPAEGEYIPLEQIPTPTQAVVEGITLIIVEVHKLQSPIGKSYIVACRIKDGDYLSPIFHVYPKDSKEFRDLIIKEINNYLKMKGIFGRGLVAPS